MATISLVVEKIISKKPFLEETLSRGIVNHAALADDLIPQIEKELGKKVKFSAVNMAIRRLSEKIKNKFDNVPVIFADCDISIRSNLIAITIYKVETSQKIIKNIYDIVDFKEGDFLTITQGLHEIMVITNEKHEKKILRLFLKTSIKAKIKNICSVSINIPPAAVETMGLIYTATRTLTWENINIIDIVSTYTELTFILKETDCARAFNVLTELINN